MILSNNNVYSRMFLWCVSGSGVVTVNGKKYRFLEDTYLILPWKHSITYRADTATPFNLGGIHIIPYYSPSLPFKPLVAHNNRQIWWKGNSIRDIQISDLYKISLGKFNKKTKGLEKLVEHTIELFHRKNFKRHTANSLAHLLLDEIMYVVKSSPISLNSNESTRFERITRYIRVNLHKDISLNQLCDIGAVSQSTLRRLFIKSVGVSPYEWIIQARIEQARYLLRTTSESISQISLKIGFEDPSYFVRLFHKRLGQTPHKYRIESFKI